MPRISARTAGPCVHLGATIGGFSLLQGRDKVARSLHMHGGDGTPVQPSGTGSENVSAMSMPMTPSSPNQKDPNGATRAQGRDPAALLSISPEARASIRIFVADDEHTLRESCANVLRLEGYQVTVSGRGQEALDLLKRTPFDKECPKNECTERQ